MNAVILFSLSQADMVNKALTPALITNIVVGFVLSRWMTFLPNSYVSEKLAPWLISLTNTATGYGYAVLGLAAGSAVFLVLSTRQVLRVLKNLDYYLFYIT